MENAKIDLILSAIQEQGKRFDEKFKGIDEKFKGIDEKFKGIDEKFKGIDEKFVLLRDEIKEQGKNFDFKLDLMNEKIQWLHEDNKRLTRTDEEIIKQNNKIENDFIKPIQQGIAIEKVKFTSIWGFVSLLIAMLASLFSFGIAKAMGM